MNTIEQAQDVAECLRALTRNRNDGSAYLIAADTIDALIAENVELESDHAECCQVIDAFQKSEAVLMEQLAQLEREMVAATLRIDNDAMELAELASIATITTDRDEWKEATISANERFKRAEAELERIKGQEPVAWIPPEHEGVYRSSSYLDASRDQLAGWVPVYLAAGAQERKPLTLGQIDELISVADQSWAGADVPIQWAEYFARAIEAKLKG